MNYNVVIPVIISFAISAVLGPIVIPFLRKLKVGQTERAELESHLKKNGTPTMGGLMILASIILTSLLYVKDYPKIIPILFMTVGFGVIGFFDDYLKVVMKRSDGLFPKQILPTATKFSISSSLLPTAKNCFLVKNMLLTLEQSTELKLIKPILKKEISA